MVLAFESTKIGIQELSNLRVVSVKFIYRHRLSKLFP